MPCIELPAGQAWFLCFPDYPGTRDEKSGL